MNAKIRKPWLIAAIVVISIVSSVVFLAIRGTAHTAETRLSPNPMVIYMTIEGETQGLIKGESMIPGREGTIEVMQYSHSIYIPRDPQTGLPVGKRVHHPLTIVKVIDRSSPLLYQACTGGEHLTVELKLWRPSPIGEEHYFTIRLEDAIIVSIRPYTPAPGRFESMEEVATLPMEEVSFTYRKIIWTYEPEALQAVEDISQRID